MSEQHNWPSDNSQVADRPPILQARGLPSALWIEIMTCRGEAGAQDGQRVSVIGPEWEGALIDDHPYVEPGGMLAIARSGIVRRIGWASPKEHPDARRSFSVTVAPTPPTATQRISVSGQGGSTGYVFTLSDRGEAGEALMSRQVRDCALSCLIDQLRRRHGAVADGDVFNDFLQQRPCTEIRGDEARTMLDMLDEVMRGSPLGDPRIHRDVKDRHKGTDTRWVQSTEDAPYRLEIERIGFRFNESGSRMVADVYFRDNPFGEGELICAVISAPCSQDTNPDNQAVVAAFYESIPFSDLVKVQWRPVALRPDERFQITSAISSQIRPANLSVMRPYA
ncbi:MAG TPA: hypothetical protein VGS28_04295 [Candidatus Saccharimonadales bacterium]|nr:hypothetical protein [Candidatus Saccharimonadales bacterium]